ncbi:unnamed protein product [Debaryomyces fabryi]|nr:unnamed protein product [Debaryomyces fabryi]
MYFTEYLPRLRSISVIIETKCTINDLINIKLNSKNQLLIKFHDYETLVNLPVQVKNDGNIRIANAHKIEDCLQLTISLTTYDSIEISEKTESFMNFSSSNLVQKWSCKDLKAKTPQTNNKNNFKFTCLHCSHEIIDSQEYNRFLDMPSELWSEMMEFWHCHKPAGEHDHQDSHRNYNGSLKPGDTDVIIGSYYLLISRCAQVEISNQDIKCVSCKHNLGILDNSIMKVFKWNLALKYHNNIETFPSYIYVYNLIVDKINLSAIRKFNITSESRQDNIFIWIMNIGVDVSTENFVLNNSLKVFYYHDDIKGISNEDESIESLVLQDDVFNEFLKELSKINSFIPNLKKKMTLKVDEELRIFNVSFIAGL